MKVWYQMVMSVKLGTGNVTAVNVLIYPKRQTMWSVLFPRKRVLDPFVVNSGNYFRERARTNVRWA